MLYNLKNRIYAIIFLSMTFPVTAIFSQDLLVDLAEPDEDGWIRLYNGGNDSDFFTYYGSNNQTFPDDTFTKGDGDTISVTGSPSGIVAFKQPFSHYTLKFQFHYPDNRQGNSGLLFHIQPGDPGLGNWPRSLESQGDPGQGMGQLWCIGKVWVTVRIRPSQGPGGYFGDVPIYDPSMDEVIYGAEDTQGKRVIAGIGGWATPELTQEMNDQWTEMQIKVHGSDSITHMINGDTMITYRDPRVANTTDPDRVDELQEKKLSSGLMGWQSEGVPILYRNIMIKLFPEDSLYESVYPEHIAGRIQKTGSIHIGKVENGLAVTGSDNLPYLIEIYDPMGRFIAKISGNSDGVHPFAVIRAQSRLFCVRIVCNGMVTRQLAVTL